MDAYGVAGGGAVMSKPAYTSVCGIPVYVDATTEPPPPIEFVSDILACDERMTEIYRMLLKTRRDISTANRAIRDWRSAR